jgi:hypothetical protein
MGVRMACPSRIVLLAYTHEVQRIIAQSLKVDW